MGTALVIMARLCDWPDPGTAAHIQPSPALMSHFPAFTGYSYSVQAAIFCNDIE